LFQRNKSSNKTFYVGFGQKESLKRNCDLEKSLRGEKNKEFIAHSTAARPTVNKGRWENQPF